MKQNGSAIIVAIDARKTANDPIEDIEARELVRNHLNLSDLTANMCAGMVGSSGWRTCNA